MGKKPSRIREAGICTAAAMLVAAIACGSAQVPAHGGDEPDERRVAIAKNADTETPGRAPPKDDETLPSPPAGAVAAVRPTGAELLAGERFEAHREKYRDWTYPQLASELRLDGARDRPLSFDPMRVRYYDLVADKLKLTPEEIALYRKGGVVNVDHGQRYGMPGAYYAIYTRDLPVLVTTDSILHALHRSYDGILKQLEQELFFTIVQQTLRAAHAELGRQAPKLKDKQLAASALDVDVYLTVAQNLLEGAGTTSNPGATLSIPSKCGNDATVRRLLTDISTLKMAQPGVYTELHGGFRPIDFSQFKPRGHYTESDTLKKYFRAVMWLGRADIGFILRPPDPRAGIEVDGDRELRSAALLALTVKDSGKLKALQGVSDVIDFLVGRADNLTLEQMSKGLDRAKITDPSMLASSTAMNDLKRALSGMGGQQIRSQVILSDPKSSEQTSLPDVFQLFGQRFLLDSFILSRVVYDSILFKEEKQLRWMPTGTDVMAALGNDEAVRILKPELERYNYSANLLAARRTAEDYRPSDWEQNAYTMWLDALRTLDDVPESKRFPQAMVGTAWRRKQLQTQLASWAELRHDTILYGKQSYTAGYLCEYPLGYVEPYPEFFARLRFLAERAAQRLEQLPLPEGQNIRSAYLRDRPASFLRNFAKTMQYLERLARKELGAQPFTPEEAGFLKKTIDARGEGSGPPTYDGWYVRLMYDGADPRKWKPTVADVHTDPQSRRVLEEGVGDVNFIVVAVDNEHHRAAYVGPVYSYYEFAETASRMTDEEWADRITRGEAPSRPEWTSAFRAPTKKRELGNVDHAPAERDPRVLKAQELLKALSQEKDPAKRAKMTAEIRKYTQQSEQIPESATGR